MLSLSSAHLPYLSENSGHNSSKILPQYPKILIPKPNSPFPFFGFSHNENPFPCKKRSASAKATRNESDSNRTPQISKTSGGPANSFLSLLCPLLKFIAKGDPSEERNDILEVMTSSVSSLARLPWGSRSLTGISQTLDPTSPLSLQLYEFEACPFCRRVREAMTELDLSVEVYPCPKGSVKHREMVRNLGGKEQFPFLVDLSTGISLYESGDIVKYLFQQYGDGRKPSFGILESTLLTGWVPTLLRAGRGMTAWNRARPTPPSKILELFSYENNLYARIVREALCELELPYVLHNVGEGSSKHELLLKTSGAQKVPYLIDPNTGFKMGDYKRILSYLFETYSAES